MKIVIFAIVVLEHYFRQVGATIVVGTSFSASASAIDRGVPFEYFGILSNHAAINRNGGRAEAGPYDVFRQRVEMSR